MKSASEAGPAPYIAMDKQELADKFLSLREDAFSPMRAEVEDRLLDYLMKLYNNGEYSLNPLVLLLTSLPDLNFDVDNDCDQPDTVSLVSSSESDLIIVTATLSEFHASVNVSCEPRDVMKTGEVSLDPRHIAFYAQWEKLLHINEATELENLTESERAVYYVALLEAQVMNGGIGQYLANTGGQHVDATVECLQTIGADKACQVLNDAVALKKPNQSFDVVWHESSEQLQQLDQTFMELGEDLAALTADKFLEV